jgi:hypothetical protein
MTINPINLPLVNINQSPTSVSLLHQALYSEDERILDLNKESLEKLLNSLTENDPDLLELITRLIKIYSSNGTWSDLAPQFMPIN